MTWPLLVFGIVANAIASVLVKGAPAIGAGGIIGLLRNWQLLMALGCYGLAFLAYAVAVQRMPLNLAHPISTAGAIVLVGLVSALLFGEGFSPLRLAGYGLLLAGILVLALSAAEPS